MLDKKYLLILLVVCIFGSLFYVAQVLQSNDSTNQPPIAEPPVEKEIPEKGFKDLTLIYYGTDQRYRMDATLKEIVQQTAGDLNFQGMEAIVQQGDEILQTLKTPAGLLTQKDGIVHLEGPVEFTAGSYQILTNRINVDLNQGSFTAQGAISATSDNVLVEAGEMSADFQLKKIHFKGRPRLTVKKGG